MEVAHMKRVFFILACSFVLFVLALPAVAQIPMTMSYQGVLTDNAGGIPPDGSHSFTFTIYDNAVGGTTLWTETQSRPVTRGGFDALLGSVNPLTIAFDKPYYLGIQVDGGAELTPRTPLATSPYSFNTKAGGGGGLG